MPMLQAPRAPVVREKSGTVDYTDRYRTKLANAREAMREQAMRQLEENKEWGNLAKYIAALEGDQWAKTRPGYRSRFTDNQLARARKESLAMYTDVRPSLSVTPGNKSYKETTDLVHNLLMHEWLRNDMDIRLTEAADHALFSVGYWKINGAPGRVSALSLGMDGVLPINSTSDLQESSAILYRTFKPAAYFLTKFKEKSAAVLRSSRQFARPGNETYSASLGMTEYTYDRLSPAMKRLMKNRRMPQSAQGEEDFFPVHELEEFWIEDPSINETGKDVIVKDPNLPIGMHNYWYRVKPGDRLFPRKRLLVFGGDELLYDGPSSYWTPKYPFARLALDPVVWAPGGLSKFRTLMPLNTGINEIGAGIFDTIKKAINQTYIYKKNSIADEDWNRFYPDMPGQKIRMSPMGNPATDIRALAAPELPAYVREFLMQYLLPIFDRHAGTMDTNSLSKKKQVPGGDTMEQIRDAQTGPIRLEGRRVETFLRDAGEIAVMHILQFFNRDHTYSILGADGLTWDHFDQKAGSMVPASMAPEAFCKMISVRIAPGSIHGAQKDREQTKAFTLFKAGAMSLHTLLKKFEIQDVEAEIERIQKEREGGLTGGGGAGRTPRMSRGQRTGAIA